MTGLLMETQYFYRYCFVGLGSFVKIATKLLASLIIR